MIDDTHGNTIKKKKPFQIIRVKYVDGTAVAVALGLDFTVSILDEWVIVFNPSCVILQTHCLADEFHTHGHRQVRCK